MKKWIVTTLVVMGLAGLAATARRWLPPFLSFVGTSSDLIQGLSDLTQLVLWSNFLKAKMSCVACTARAPFGW